MGREWGSLTFRSVFSYLSVRRLSYFVARLHSLLTSAQIHSLKFVPKSKDTAPKTVKLYANRLQMGFDETESVEATQTLELSDTDFAKGAVTNLRFVKFQNVNSIVVGE